MGDSSAVSKWVSKVEGSEFIFEGVFDAPREHVFKAFSEPEHWKIWWCPRGWTVMACTMDFRPGGAWHYGIKLMDENPGHAGEYYGMESWGKAVYEEIVDGARIVYREYYSDAEGHEWRRFPGFFIEMDFIEQGGRTKLISRTQFSSADELERIRGMGMEQGMSETWNRLAEYLHT